MDIRKDLILQNPIEEATNKDHKPTLFISAALASLLAYMKNRSEVKKMIENKYYLSSYKRIPLTESNIQKYINQNGELMEYSNLMSSVEGFIYVDSSNFVALVAVKRYGTTVVMDKVIINDDYVSHGIFHQLMDVAICDLGVNTLYAEQSQNTCTGIYLKCGFEKAYSVDTRVMKMTMKKVRASSDKKPIFIVTSFNRKSNISKIIATITRSLFSHASLALDYHLKEIYSFGSNGGNVSGGLQTEDLQGFKDTDSVIRVNCIFVKSSEYDLIKTTIKDIQSNPTKYNFWNLINIMNRKEEETDTESMICSQFVAYLLSIIKSNPIIKPLNLITPDDLARLCDNTKYVYKVYEGAAMNYNSSLVHNRILNLTSKAIVNEAGDYAGKKRSELPDSVFGIPELRKYPMPDEKHTRSAIKLFNHVDKEHEEELAKAIIKNMKKYNIDPSVVGPNNRLRKYLPKDMIKESGIIFSRDDIYYNFEDFQNKKSNLVIVLGVSGSGKTTLSCQLAQQYNAELLSLDDFFYTHCADETKSELCKKWLKSKLGKEYMDLKRSKVKIDRKYIMKYSDEVFKFIFSNVSKGSKQYILEGMQITSMMTPEEIVKYPVIIKETSMLRTFYQRIRRDGNLGKGNIVQIIKWYQSSLEEINGVKDAMNESNEYILKEAEIPIKNIVFDIGSVLIKCDFEKEYERCKLIPEQYKAEVKKAWWFSDKVTYIETCSKDEYIELVSKRIISPEAKPYAKVMLELYMDIMKPYHYANKLVYDLKESGYNVYFLSNWDKWSSTALIEAGEMEFLKDMKGGIFSWEVQKTKPNKDMYEEFLSRFNLNPNECLFLDDREDNVEGAKKVGMKGIVFYPKTTPAYLYENYIHKSYTESMLSEYGTTAGTVVGSNQADSVYIVNYMKKNTFNPEPRLGICKYGMKDLHIKGGKYDRVHHVDLDEFEDEASDIEVYKYNGPKKNSFYEIIEDAESDKDFYELLTGTRYRDIDDLRYNNLFEQEVSFIDTLKIMSECTYAKIISESQDLKEIPILMENVQGRKYNYYRDLNGEFIKNELTGMRSKSYDSKDDIPDAIRNAVIAGLI